MNNISIRVQRLTDRLDIPALAYATPGSSGLDLYAAIDEPVSLRGGGAAMIPVGYAVEIPEGFEGQIRGRSGLARDEHIGITNGIGTIDSDYRGELAVLLSHFGHITEHKWIMPGEKIAQLVIVPVMHADITEVDVLSTTDRGASGFGSTGNGLAPAASTPADPATIVPPAADKTPAAPAASGDAQAATGTDAAAADTGAGTPGNADANASGGADAAAPQSGASTAQTTGGAADAGNAAAGAATDASANASTSAAPAGSATDAGTSSGTADAAAAPAGDAASQPAADATAGAPATA